MDVIHIKKVEEKFTGFDGVLLKLITSKMNDIYVKINKRFV